MSFSLSSSGVGIVAAAAAVAAFACGGATESAQQSPPGSSSSSSSSSSSGGVTPPSDSSAPKCDASAAKDIAVASDDLNGYPPYAIAECSLVYVSSAGELVLRDLVTSAEMKIAPVADKPRRPTVSVSIDASGTRHLLLAWETTLAQGPAVRVRYNDVVTTMKGDGQFVMAGEPRVRDHWVTFTAWKTATETDDTDVWLYDARSDKTRVIFGGPAQQRFADVSATHVVATDFTEDPDGHFDRMSDLADLIIYEIASEKITKRPAPGKQAFPMISNSGALAYLEWTEVHSEPKLGGYDLKAGTLFGSPPSDKLIAQVKYSGEPARPALAGETLEWVGNPDGRTTLYRAPVDGSAAPTIVSGLDGLFLYAPAPRPTMGGDRIGFTVVATTDLARTQPGPRLRAVSR